VTENKWFSRKIPTGNGKRRFGDLELGFCKEQNEEIGETDMKFIAIFYNRDTRAIANEGKNMRSTAIAESRSWAGRRAVA
jgi:hypothetical protein